MYSTWAPSVFVSTFRVEWREHSTSRPPVRSSPPLRLTPDLGLRPVESVLVQAFDLDHPGRRPGCGQLSRDLGRDHRAYNRAGAAVDWQAARADGMAVSAFLNQPLLAQSVVLRPDRGSLTRAARAHPGP